MNKNLAIVEKSIVNSKRVCCGSNSVKDHPKVYMEIDESRNAKCQYCGKIFIYKEKVSQWSKINKKNL